MRQRVDEINQLPPDFEETGAKEFAALPDEFNRGETKAKPPKKKPSSVRKVMLYIATAGVVTVGLITPVVRVIPPDTSEPAVVEATETPIPTVKATPHITPAATIKPTDQPTPAPTPTMTPEPTQEPTPTPRMTGEIHITVYSEVFDRLAAEGELYPSQVLADETLPAETFTEYVLPELPEQDGYRSLGYVLTSSSSQSYLDTLYTGEEEPHVLGTVALGDTLTADDLEIVPKNIQGTYEAEIHAVWLSQASDYHLEFYDGDTLFGDYYVGFPIYSEQLCYLAPFPTPTKEGKTFAGWQNVDGYLVDTVTYFEFFEKLPDAQTLEDRDWNKPMPCRVYACWSDGSGGAPDPTPTPTPTPRPVYYTVQIGYMCSFSSSGSYGGGSKRVEKGQSVTVYVVLYDTYEDTTGEFLITYLKSEREVSKRVTPYKKVETDDGGYYFYFKVSVQVTEDLEIDFPW